MARQNNLKPQPTETESAQLSTPAAGLPAPKRETTLHMYSGNVMRTKVESGYVLVMVKHANGTPVKERPACIFLEQDAALLASLKVGVGDTVAWVAESLDESDMFLPKDNEMVLRTFNYQPGTLSIVRRKRKPAELHVDSRPEAQPTPGIAKRLAELGSALAKFLSGKK